MSSLYCGHLNIEFTDAIKVAEAELGTSCPLVRTFDSTADRSTIERVVSTAIGRPLSNMQDLVELAMTDVFCGFDEIWICSSDSINDMQTHCCPQLTNDRVMFNEESDVPEVLVDLIEAGSVHCVLATGFGLSYVTDNAWLAQKIESLGL